MLLMRDLMAQHCAGERIYAEVYGDRAGATLDPLRIYTERDGQFVDMAPQFPDVKGHEAEIAHFVDCVRKGSQPIASGEEAHAVMKVMDAIYKSASTRKEVKVG